MKHSILLCAALLAVTAASIRAARVYGYIKTAAGTPVANVSVRYAGTAYIGGSPQSFDGTLTTNSFGLYEQEYTGGTGRTDYWNGTLTPSYKTEVFSPSSASFTRQSFTADLRQDFTAGVSTPSNYTYSGYVRTSGGTGVSGVSVVFSNRGGTVSTSASGYYTNTLDAGYSGTVAPSATGYLFSPSAKVISSISGNMTNQNFEGTYTTYYIYGWVLDKVAGLGNIPVVFSGLDTVTTWPGNALDPETGYYEKAVPHGWSGTVYPAATGYYFDPEVRTYSGVTAEQENQNFSKGCIISGVTTNSAGTALAGVTVAFAGTSHALGSNFAITRSAVSGADGTYHFHVPYSYTGTVTPSKTGCTFTPASRTYSHQTVSYFSQDFLFAPVISGRCAAPDGNPVYNLILSFDNGGGTDTNTAAGTYSHTPAYGWSGTVVPSNPADDTAAGLVTSFVPAGRTYGSLVADVPDQDYEVILPEITVAGTVRVATADSSRLLAVAGAAVVFVNRGTTYTDSTGAFSHTVQYTQYNRYYGKAIPGHPDYVFTPEELRLSAARDTVLPLFTATPKNEHVITASGGAGGVVAPAGERVVKERDNITYTFTPGNGYSVRSVMIDSVDYGAIPAYTFTEVKDSHTVTAAFEPAGEQHLVYAAAVGQSGAIPDRVGIAPAGSLLVNEGAGIRFTMTGDPASYGVSGTILRDLIIDNVPVDSLAPYRSAWPPYQFTYGFDDITADHTIVAVFGRAGGGTNLVITSMALPGGAIFPSGYLTAHPGTDQRFTIVPQTGYDILDVLVDGIARGPLTEFTFTDIQQQHMIMASFKKAATGIRSVPPVNSGVPVLRVVPANGGLSITAAVPRSGPAVLSVSGIDGKTEEDIFRGSVRSGHNETFHYVPARPGICFISIAGRGYAACRKAVYIAR